MSALNRPRVLPAPCRVAAPAVKPAPARKPAPLPSPEFTARTLDDAWNAGYEHASLHRDVFAGAASVDPDSELVECHDPRIVGWTEEHPRFYAVHAEFTRGLAAGILNCAERADLYVDLRACADIMDKLN